MKSESRNKKSTYYRINRIDFTKFYLIKKVKGGTGRNMPTVKSKLKEALDIELKKATDTLLRYPQDSDGVKVALDYVNAIRRIIDVCEERKRY